jgi:nucleoside-diphosphate-sugar epimerase
MQIVFTGATSFTGSWFIKKLSEKGHTLYAPIQKEASAYEGIRKERLTQIQSLSQPHFEAPFGSERFFAFLESLPEIDLFCHHAADVTNYKSPEFDAIKALENNTRGLDSLLHLLKRKGCSTFVLTGSVFEPGEGKGSDHLRAVSPYGLSKGLTTSYYSYYCDRAGIALKHFVIPNPFGPYEDFRFTSFLAKTWLEGKTAPITHPNYVRDNIPVPLLAEVYAGFCEDNTPKINPSCYVGSQQEFTLRFKEAMQPRLKVPCEVEFKIQTDFSEPLIRVNTDTVHPDGMENEFWDELAQFYLSHYT